MASGITLAGEVVFVEVAEPNPPPWGNSVFRSKISRFRSFFVEISLVIFGSNFAPYSDLTGFFWGAPEKVNYWGLQKF